MIARLIDGHVVALLRIEAGNLIHRRPVLPAGQVRDDHLGEVRVRQLEPQGLLQAVLRDAIAAVGPHESHGLHRGVDLAEGHRDRIAVRRPSAVRRPAPATYFGRSLASSSSFRPASPSSSSKPLIKPSMPMRNGVRAGEDAASAARPRPRPYRTGPAACRRRRVGPDRSPDRRPRRDLVTGQFVGDRFDLFERDVAELAVGVGRDKVVRVFEVLEVVPQTVSGGRLGAGVVLQVIEPVRGDRHRQVPFEQFPAAGGQQQGFARPCRIDSRASFSFLPGLYGPLSAFFTRYRVNAGLVGVAAAVGFEPLREHDDVAFGQLVRQRQPGGLAERTGPQQGEQRRGGAGAGRRSCGHALGGTRGIENAGASRPASVSVLLHDLRPVDPVQAEPIPAVPLRGRDERSRPRRTVGSGCTGSPHPRRA